MTQFTPGSEWLLRNCNDKSHDGTRVVYVAPRGGYHEVHCKADPREIRYVQSDMLELPTAPVGLWQLHELLRTYNRANLLDLLMWLCREYPEITEADIRRWRGF